jgi:hypothetical protein
MWLKKLYLLVAAANHTHIYALPTTASTYEQCNGAYIYLSTKQLNLNLDVPVTSMCAAR